ELEGNLATLGGAFCFMPRQAIANVWQLGTSFLGLLWGAAPLPLADAAVQTRVHQGMAYAWPVLGAYLLIVAGVVVWSWRTLWARRQTPLAQLGVFLVLVGAQSVGVYAVSRCGPMSVLTVRYALLGIFVPTGLALLAWSTDAPRLLRQGVITAFVALTALNGWTHLQLWREQLAGMPVPNRAQLARALEARGIRYARSDYWTAYYVDFVSQERVTVGADALSRVDIYERALAQHAADVVRLSTTPCDDGSPEIVPGYHVCRDAAP
ncbi:MAG TPA: hypothetical protein VMF13_01820, partial [Luteitalea sp.]|nr:hypothetical protein [Luteitalea sp.]